ncbi:MAG: protein-arginine deiminase family protein [Bryobacteraceae bacterium]
MSRVPSVVAAVILAGWLSTVTACSASRAAAPSRVDLDLDADTDHTGAVEHSAAEEELEDKDGEEGLIVLPNWDDDDPPDTKGYGVPDCLTENRFSRIAFADRRDRFDNEINGEKDREEDLQLLTLRRTLRLPPGVRIVLRVSAADAEKVRVFDEKDRPVIVPAAAAEFVEHKKGTPHNEHEVPNLEGPENESLDYRVEGILPGARLRIELVALEEGREAGRDVVRVRVAPFLLLPNERPVSQALAADFRSLPPSFRLVVLPGLTVEEDRVRQASEDLAPTLSAPPTDTFWQDSLQTGYAVAPGPGHVRVMKLLARLPRGARNFWEPKPEVGISPQISRAAEAQHWLWPNRSSEWFGTHPALLGPGVGVFEISDFSEATVSDYGGNLEVTGPLPGSPFGRIVIGKEMSASYREFIEKQDVQTPIVEIELAWLFNRHVDDVVYFLPGKQAAVASPSLGEHLLREYSRKNPGRVAFLKGREVHTGVLSGVEAAGEHLILMESGIDLSAVRPGMYLHVYQGPGRYQTYDILRANSRAMVLQREAARYFSFWRSDPPETPAPGSRYVIVEQPLHDVRSAVRVLTLAELFDTAPTDSAGNVRTDNRKVREFWEQNRMAGDQIRTRILPGIRKLAPAGIIELPVLFHTLSLSDRRTGSAAFTPNLVNGHLFGRTFLMPKPFVVTTPSGDLFEESARAALSGFSPRFVDDYFMFHNFQGDVHCALNLILEPPGEGPYWWQRKR